MKKIKPNKPTIFRYNSAGNSWDLKDGVIENVELRSYTTIDINSFIEELKDLKRRHKGKKINIRFCVEYGYYDETWAAMKVYDRSKI